jgi:hypothetical protein
MVDVHHGVFSDHYQIRSSIFLSPEYDINLLVKNSHRNKYHQQVVSCCEFSFQLVVRGGRPFNAMLVGTFPADPADVKVVIQRRKRRRGIS